MKPYHNGPNLPTCDKCGRTHNCYNQELCASCQIDRAESERQEMFQDEKPGIRRSYIIRRKPMYATALLVLGTGIIGLIGMFYALAAAIRFIVGFWP